MPSPFLPRFSRGTQGQGATAPKAGFAGGPKKSRSSLARFLGRDRNPKGAAKPQAERASAGRRGIRPPAVPARDGQVGRESGRRKSSRTAGVADDAVSQWSRAGGYRSGQQSGSTKYWTLAEDSLATILTAVKSQAAHRVIGEFWATSPGSFNCWRPTGCEVQSDLTVLDYRISCLRACAHTACPEYRI
jgi:hypothetical protein